MSVSRTAKKLPPEPVAVGRHLVVDAGVCHGQLTFRGTRVPAHSVLVYMSKGRTIDDILADWPELKREAVIEALQLAADALVEQALATAKAANDPDHP